MGDGCLTSYKKWDGFYAYDIIIVGDKYKDKEYHYYLKKLKEKEFDIKAKIVEIKSRDYRKIIIKRKGLFESLNKLGFPIGKKGKRLAIPKQIIKLDWSKKKNIIRGLFDTDGSILAKKHEKYRYPYITICSMSDKLLLQLLKLLRKNNYPFYIIKNKKYTGGIWMRGNKNVIRWMNDIGSSNDKHLFKYKYWLKNGSLPPKVYNPIGLVG